MELTDTRPAATTASVARAQPTGLSGLLGSGDHKVIGRLFILASLGVVAASEVLVTLLRVDTYDTQTHQLLTDARWASLQTLQPSGVVFVGLIPLLLGIALTVVPLQIGARSVAFPRAAAAGFWTYFVGGGLFITSYFIDGGPTGTRIEAVELWALSFIMVLIAIVVVAVTLVTTVFTQRAPGMSMTRVPMFSWAIVVAGVLWALTLPILAALILLAFVDFQHGGIFSGAGGGLDSTMFSQVVWALRQPQIYAIAIPGLGIAADIVTTFSRARDDYRRLISMFMIGLFGALAFGAYTVTSYGVFPVGTVAEMPYSNPVLIVASLLIVLPILGLFGQFADSMRRGRAEGKPVAGAPLPMAMVSMLLALFAVVVGAIEPIERFDLHNTLFTDAQFQLVVGATIMAALAGLFYWSSKIVGAKASDLAGYGAAALGLLGTLGLAGGNILAQFGGDAKQHSVGTEAFNALSTLGAAGIAGAVFVSGFALAAAIRNRGAQTPADPWDAGQTLEWATLSPPAYDNFVEVPPVHSEAPLLDQLTSNGEEA